VDPLEPTSSWTLLRHYFFFGWLFRDVSQGNLLERAAAWRHNQAQARWLPTYMRRWLGCGLGCFCLGALVEGALAQPLLAAAFYLPSVVSVSVEAVICAAWLGLKVLPGPL
jgi:hypothetical protein